MRIKSVVGDVGGRSVAAGEGERWIRGLVRQAAPLASQSTNHCSTTSAPPRKDEC